MNTSDTAKALAQRYIDAINQSDLEELLALFADHVVWEDPYGMEPVHGRVALRDIYGSVIDDLRLTLDTPIRGSHGDRAALAISFDWISDGKPAHTQAISVITADDQGLISHLQAYWAPDDHELLDDTTTD